MTDHITDAELHSVHSFHSFTACVIAAGIGVISTLVTFMSLTGAGF